MRTTYRTKEEMYEDWKIRFSDKEEYHDIHGFYIGPGSPQVDDMPNWAYGILGIGSIIIVILLIVNLI